MAMVSVVLLLPVWTNL